MKFWHRLTTGCGSQQGKAVTTDNNTERKSLKLWKIQHWKAMSHSHTQSSSQASYIAS